MRFRIRKLIKLTTQAAIAAVVLLGCSDEVEEYKFVPGNVIVGFNKDVTLRQALEFGAEQADSIATIRGFDYYSYLPNDSLDFINKTFNREGFKNAYAFIHFTENRLVIIHSYLNDDDKSTIYRWLTITEDPIFQFEDRQSYKSMMFFIPPGTEKKWIEKHTNHPYVSYLELNYYTPF